MTTRCIASFQRCADLGALPLVHAENGDVVAALSQKLLAAGNNGPEGHAYSRPPEVEGEATNRAIMIADMAGVPLYVVHVSCEQAHEAIRRARQKGMRVFGEPLVQHLTLDESEYFNKDWDHAARRVMSPPFRNKLHQDSLWAGLQAGSLQVVATDHCAFTTKQKRNGVGDFTKIPNGTGGLEDRMPVLWTTGVNTGRLTMNEFVAVTSTNIAKILNMYPKKGAIVEGADADIVVWDPKRKKTISVEEAAVGDRLQCLRRLRGDRPAALRLLARRTVDRGSRGQGQAGPRPIRRPRAECGGQPGAVDVEGNHRAAQGRTHRHSGDRGLSLARSAALIRLVLATVAGGPATAAGVLAGAWGNDVGCAGVKAGYQDSDAYIVLTAEGIETYGSGCRFAQQLTTVPGAQSLSSRPVPPRARRGRRSKQLWSPTRERMVSFVTIPGLEELGPLQSCS